jgi:Flp pilus assembly protein TadD
MATITEALTIALDLHLSGRLGEAQDLYTRILDVDPDHPDALHFLGVLAGQIGQGDLGLPLIVRALALRPDAADIHANHATILAV